MKRNVRFLFIPCAAIGIASACFAQPAPLIPMDFKGEAPSPNGCFIENVGQLLGTDGASAAKVKAYSMQYFPQMFIERDNTFSIALDARDTIAATLDTIVKFTIKFIGDDLNPQSYVSLHEPLADEYNFVLGHLASPLLGLTSYRRVIYRDVYPYIDVHVYSNQWGPKLYMVMRPGSDPTDLHMKFIGQDSLIMDAFGYLRPYIDGRNIVMPKGLCYQEIGGNLVLVNAQLGYQLDQGSAEVNFLPVTYNPDYPLIIDISAIGPAGGANDILPPKWNTFYGHTADDWANDGVALPGGGLLVSGTTYSQLFPVFNAQVGLFQGSRMAYISEFDGQYARIYTTLFGGNGGEDGQSVALSSDGNSVYLFGKTNSTNLLVTNPGGGVFYDSSPGSNNCYIARLSRALPAGNPEWVTYFGDGIGSCDCIRLNSQGELYILGSTSGLTAPNVQSTCNGSNGSFPMCNQLGSQAYQQAANAGQGDVFLARFNAQRQLVHSTFFGGNASDIPTKLAIHPTNGRVYFTGQTSSPRLAYTNCQPPTSGSFPLCNLSGSYFQQDLNNNQPLFTTDAFIAALESNGSLLWSTYFGGDAFDVGRVITINPVSNQLYVGGQANTAVGYATNNNCLPPNGGGFPNCASGTQARYPYGGNIDGFIARFSLSNHSLGWTTFIGRDRFDKVSALDWDEGGNLWVAGSTDANSTTTGSIPLAELFGIYYQDTHGDGGQTFTGSDAMVFSFNSADELRHGTYMGGVGSDDPHVLSVAITGQVFLAGSSMSTSEYPFACPSTTDPYCYLTYATMVDGTMEAFYTDLRHNGEVGIEELATASDAVVVLFPNPATHELFVQLPNDTFGWVEVRIHDTLGKLVRTVAQARVERANTLRLDIGGLSSGLYAVSVLNEVGSYVGSAKLIVE